MIDAITIEEPRSADWPNRVACALSCVTLVFASVAVALAVANDRPWQVTYNCVSITFAAVGTLLVWRRAGGRIGWVLLASGVTLAIFNASEEWSYHAFEVDPGSLPGADFAAWLNWLPIVLTTLLLQLLPQLYPNGELISRRWRVGVWAALAFLLLGTISNAFIPQPVEGLNNVSNPYAIESAKGLFTAMQALALPLMLVGIGAGLLSLIVRWRRSHGDERQQLKWFLAGVLPFLLVVALHDVFGDVSNALAGLAVAVIPAVLGVAILRYRLYDLDFFVSRALIFAVLSAMIVAVYLCVVTVVGLAVGGSGVFVQAIATIGAAAALLPMRTFTQRGVDRYLFGNRARPYEALTQLGRRLEQAPVLETVLQSVVDTVAEALRLPFTAIELREGGGWLTAAQTGARAVEAESFPMVYQGEMIGRLVAAHRGPSEAFNAADRSLLTDLARQAGIAAHAVRVTSELQRSRSELVSAREEERRRLRRDLHDGLGPALAGVMLGLHAARETVHGDPVSAASLLGRLEGQVEEAVHDIRRLVYGLRPPALDEVGLVRALQQQAARLEGDASGLTVSIDAPTEGLGQLPAAVEVAAYRIAMEALTNVSRHAAARFCTVQLTRNQGLELQIIDDGSGLAATAVQGVGLAAMKERASELGGSLEISSSAGGTSVKAVLPVTPRND